MERIFLEVLNRSLISGLIVVVILVLRQIFRHVPKKYFVLLWGLVAVRLLIPFHIESQFSLIPATNVVFVDVYETDKHIVETDIDNLDGDDMPVFLESSSNAGETGSGISSKIVYYSAYVWAFGTLGLTVYAFADFLRIKRKVAVSVGEGDGIRICDYIETSFILGVFKPVIYLPSNLPASDKEHILAHERAHLKRGDHIIKPLAFLVLALFWVNPLIWVAYFVLCYDIEYACDEYVLVNNSGISKRDYAKVLLHSCIPSRIHFSIPLSFSQPGVRHRIKRIINQKKPAVITSALLLIIGILAAICFLTDPVKGSSNDSAVATESTNKTTADNASEDENINTWKGDETKQDSSQMENVTEQADVIRDDTTTKPEVISLRSNVFTQEDYYLAVEVAVNDFNVRFEGCNLLKVSCISESDPDPVFVDYWAHPEKYMLLRLNYVEPDDSIVSSSIREEKEMVWIMSKNEGNWVVHDIGIR
ncbi:MAG: M56 family metallopeptidase [Lachnospiraceae bacterium]|nr:M56 family metallopeptidase [Lachnospiraceae bacterium]